MLNGKKDGENSGSDSVGRLDTYSAGREIAFIVRMTRKSDGSVTFLVAVFLALLAVLGICVSDNANLEKLITRNEAAYLRDFFIAEGGVSRELQEICNGSYRIPDIHTRMTLAMDSATDLPLPRPHLVAGVPYTFLVSYSGMSIPSKGFSAVAFQQYDYRIDAQRNRVGIRTLYRKIAPKPNR